MNDHDDDHDGHHELDLADLAGYCADLAVTLTMLPPDDSRRANIATEFDRAVSALDAATRAIGSPGTP